MKKALRTTFALMICAVIIVGFYMYLNKAAGDRTEDKQQTAAVTEKDRLLEADFVKYYPPTPREVMKWYNRYSKLCFGENKPSKKETTQIAANMHMLLDSELATQNGEKEYADSLWKEVQDFKQRKAKLVETQVCDTDDVIYKTVKDKNYAYVQTSYFVREASTYTKTYQKFVLREDSEGNWKILGFTRTDQDGTPKETN